MAEETTKEGTPTEPTGKYLTRSYLVQSFKDFWSSVKAYLDNALSKKVDTVDGQGLSSNDFTDTERDKLRDIEANANNYSHPTTSGNQHIPSGGTKGQILRWSSDGTAVWGDDTNTTYSEATKEAPGLMSVTDKNKLDGIAEGANKIVVADTLETDNPVKGTVIKEALNDKADNIEKTGTDANSDLIVVTDSGDEGDFTLTFKQGFKHLKMHLFYKGDHKCIERFYISKNGATFGDDSGEVTINNPDGSKIKETNIYPFYIECLEGVDGTKYKPFILKVNRTSTNMGGIRWNPPYITNL